MKNRNKDRNVIEIGGSVLKNEESYGEQALKVVDYLKVVKLDRVHIVDSAVRGETDRLLGSMLDECVDKEYINEALKGRCDENEIAEHLRKEIAEMLLIEEIESTRIFSEELSKLGVKNRVFIQGRNYPIIANNGYLNAKVDLEASKKRFLEIDKKIEEDVKVVLYAGFGAENKDGEKVLLGRNSSDYIAAIIGSLDDRVGTVIFRKDVDGLYLNYGRSNESLVTHMNYDEARILLSQNPEVLHKGVLEVANGYKIIVENCNKPIGSGGTLIMNYRSFSGGDSGPD